VNLAVLGDVHGPSVILDRALERLGAEPLDGVLLVGDLSAGMHLVSGLSPDTEQEMRDTAAEVVRQVEALGVPVLWVPGNHDLRDLRGPGNVDGRVADLAGVRVAGIGGGGPMQFGFAYEWGEDEIRGMSLPDHDLLLSHAPPVDTEIDATLYGNHAGSNAIRERAEALDGVLVCGHIHEAAGSVQLGRCLCLNAGSLGGMNANPKVGFVKRDEGWEVSLFDLDGGETQVWRRT
jgi:uncharacterized protein